MFERFTKPARQVVIVAQLAARRLHHDHIGTEHILLGLLEAEDAEGELLAGFGVTAEAVERRIREIVGGGTDDAAALAAIGIDLEEVRRRVEASFGPDAFRQAAGRGRTGWLGRVPFTPRAKKVLELGLREAVRLRHDHIGPEHVLLGLLREGQGLAAQVMVELGADLDAVRNAVLDDLRRAG
jgi:ATP-dependent Clp protease ATP-binding subunit ClpA